MGGLRFSSIAAMPERMRKMAEAQSGNEQPVRAATPRQRRPSRDEEHNEQVVLFNRIRTLALNDSRYAVPADRTYAIPNGGGRSKREAGRLKAEGVRAGVSDVFCSVARGGFHGLYIEMKSMTGSPSREQSEWVADSIREGYQAVVCRGADAAFRVWKEYVDG